MSGTSASSSAPSDTDLWLDPPPDGGQSAFPEPAMVVEADGGGGMSDGFDEDSQVEGASQSGRPNMAILGVALLISVSVVAGVGYGGYQKFFKKNAPDTVAVGPESSVAASMMSAPVGSVAGTGGGGVFDAAAVPGAPNGAVDSAASVFASSAPTAQEMAAATSLPAAESAVGTPAGSTPPVAATAATAAATAVDASAQVRAVEAKAPAQANVAHAGPTLDSTAPASPVVEKTTTATTASAPEKARKSPPAKPAARAPKNQKTEVMVARSPVKKRVRPLARNSNKRKDNAATAVAASKPEPVNVKVVGVYPLTGKNAQAWLRNGQGSTVVVREGDVINGISILAVVPEKGLVKTSAGDLTSRGFVQ